jgi:hypothetical protein
METVTPRKACTGDAAEPYVFARLTVRIMGSFDAVTASSASRLILLPVNSMSRRGAGRYRQGVRRDALACATLMSRVFSLRRFTIPHKVNHHPAGRTSCEAKPLV